MTEQLAYNLFCYIFVGVIGNAILCWEFGKKGFIGAGLEGVKNKRIHFAMLCFMVMLFWGSIRKLNNPISSWLGLLFPAWGLIVGTVSHFLVPKSVRIYRKANFLHETTYTGNWLKAEPEVPYEQLRMNERLIRAEALYMEALKIQERISGQSDNDAMNIQNEMNRAATCLQLTLLFMQQHDVNKAAGMSRKSISAIKPLHKRFPDNTEILALKSSIYFRAAEIGQMQGNYAKAAYSYKSSLKIDEMLGNERDMAVTASRIRELDASLGRPENTDA